MADLPESSRLDELFWRARAIADVQQRESFVRSVEQKVGTLGNELRALLDAVPQADEFFDRSHLRSSSSNLPKKLERIISADPDTSVSGAAFPEGGALPEGLGPYRIVKLVGQGGMGNVYLAEQLAPVRRQVAVKVIKPGMDSQQIIARFNFEYQTLALMDHPNIARVLDAGTTQRGLPFFVMEFVDGIPIIEYCSRYSLSVEERIGLFQAACGAIQHAHNKGVLHRDIKPSNLLVTEIDGVATIKVIDFGISKALHNGLPENHLLSALFPAAGTPLYMSPEQARRSPASIDTRSDVYSLGVVLYELLTGCTPVAPEVVEDLDPVELRDRIAAAEPIAPSRHASLDRSRRHRSGIGPAGSPPTVQKPLKIEKELDWITLKALHRDPSIRYQSPRDLIADLQRFLEGKGVAASPPSRIYAWRKWARQHRLALTAAAAVLLSVLVGAGIAAQAAKRAVAAERIASRNLALKTEQESELRRLLYASDMDAAAEATRDGDLQKMRSLLRRQIPKQPGVEDNRGFEWFHYWNKLDVETSVLLQQEEPVYAIECSPDGKLLAVGNGDGRITLLSADEFNIIDQFSTGQDIAFSLDFIDNQRLLCGGGDGSVVLLAVPTGKVIDRFQVADRGWVAVAWSKRPRGIATGDIEGRLHFFAWPEDGAGLPGSPVLLHHFRKDVRNLLVSDRQADLQHPTTTDDRALLFAGDSWGDTTVHDLDTLKPLLLDDQARGMQGVRGWAMSPDGRLVAGIQLRGLLSLYQTFPDVRLLLRTLMPADLHSVAFASDGLHIFVGDANGYLHRIPVSLEVDALFMQAGPSLRDDIESTKLHRRKIEAIHSLPNRRALLTGAREGGVKLTRRTPDTTLYRLSTEATDLACTTTGQLLVADGSVQQVPIDAGDGSRPLQPLLPEDKWHSLQVAELAGVVFAARDERELWVWRLDALEQRRLVWESRQEKIIRWKVTNDGRWLIVNLERRDPRSHRMVIVDLSLGRELTSWPSNLVKAIAISPDQQTLAYSNNDDVEIRTLPEGKFVGKLPGHTTTIRDIQFSNDGETLASISDDRTIRCWNLTDRHLIWSDVAHGNRAVALAFHPDGRTLASAGDDSIVRFWRFLTGQQVGEIPVETGTIKQITFDSTGESLFIRRREADIVVLRAPKD